MQKLLGHGGVTNENEQFKELINEMDIDGDGVISFPEFEKMMELILQNIKT